MKNGWSCLGSSCKASHKFHQRYLSSGTCLITLIIAQWPGGKASFWGSPPSGHSCESLSPRSSLLLLKAIKSRPDELARRQESQVVIIWYCKVNYTLHRPAERDVSKGPKGCNQDVCTLWGSSITQRKCLNRSSTQGDNESLTSLSVVSRKNKRKGGKNNYNIISDV